jgi:hypothetical protein
LLLLRIGGNVYCCEFPACGDFDSNLPHSLETIETTQAIAWRPWGLEPIFSEQQKNFVKHVLSCLRVIYNKKENATSRNESNAETILLANFWQIIAR